MSAAVENTIDNVGVSSPPSDTNVPLFRQQYPEYNSVNDDDLMNAVHQKHYSDTPFEDFKSAFVNKFSEPPKEGGLIDSFTKGVKSGFNSIDAGIYGMLNRIGGVAGGWDLSEFQKKQEENAPDESARFETILSHPTAKGIFKFLAYQAGQAVPWIPTMMIPEVGGTAVAEKIAWSAGAGTAATKMLQIGGGALASALAMSTISAGDTYSQALREGHTEEEASSIADKTLAMSMPVNVIAGSIQAGKLLKGLRAEGIPITEELVKRTVGLSLKDVGVSALTGAVQISGQSIASNIALDHPWNEGLAESATSGAVLGLGMGGASEMMGRLGEHAKVPIERKMQELKIPDETGKVPEPIESPEGKVEPTAEELATAENRVKNIQAINEPQTLEDQITSIKNQLSTNSDGTKDRITAIRLAAIEGHLDKMGKSRNDVLTELSDLYDQSIGNAERKQQIVKITNESIPDTPSKIIDALADETPKAIAPKTPEDFNAKAEEIKADPALSEDAKAQALKVLEENSQGAKSIETMKSVISEEERPQVDAILEALANTRGVPVNEFINGLVKPENIKVDEPIPGTTLKQSVNPDYTAQAKELGVIFNGMQEMGKGRELPMFTDPQTKSSFLVGEKESISDALNRIRKPFGTTLFQGEQDYTKGAVQLRENGKNLLYLYTGKLPGTLASDAITIAHEMFHLTTPFLNDAERAILSEHSGKNVSEWQPEHHEKYASMFTDYLLDGKAPNKGLQPVFDKIKEFLYNVYKKLTGVSADITIPDDIRKVFDSMLDVEKNKKLQEDYRQSHSDFLAEHNEQIVDGKIKQVGFFKDVNQQDREYLHNQLKSYGYQSEDMLNGDIAFYQTRTDNVNRAIAYSTKESQGKIQPKELEMLRRAQGHSWESARLEAEAWRRNAVTKTEPSPQTEPVANKEYDALAENIVTQEDLDKMFESPELKGASSIRKPSGEDARGPISERVEISKSNKAIINEASNIRATNPELADALENIVKSKLPENNPVNYVTPESHLTPDDVSRIKNHYDAVNQMVSALDGIKSATSNDTRERMWQLYEESRLYLDDPVNADEVNLIKADPSYSAIRNIEPMEPDTRNALYDILGLSKEDGDKLSEYSLSSMAKNSNMLLYQKVGLPEDDAQDVYTVGKLILDRDIPHDLHTNLRRIGMSGEQLRNRWVRMCNFVGLPQVMGFWNENAGRIWAEQDIVDARKNRIVTEQRNQIGDFLKKSRQHRGEIYDILTKGTTYGVSSYDAIESKRQKPWESKDWITKTDADEMVKKGDITQEDADAIKQRQDNLRASYKPLDNTVGKVFSENEVLKMGYTKEHYKDYMAIRKVDDAMTALQKRSAILNGMSPADAEKTYDLPGYHPLARSDGKWLLEYKDPTSPTGYSSTRYDKPEIAEADRQSMIKKGIIDPKQDISKVKLVVDAVKSQSKYINSEDLRSIMEDAGDFEQIKKRLDDPNVPESEKQLLMVQKEFGDALINAVKSRNWNQARTIHRGNIGMNIVPEDMDKVLDTWINKSAGSYSRAVSSSYMGSLSNQLNIHPDNESPEAQSYRETWRNVVNKQLDASTAYQDPDAGHAWRVLRSLGFIKNMAGNVSSAFVHASHTLLTLPSEMYKWNQDIASNSKNWVRAEAAAIKMAFGGELPEDLVRNYPEMKSTLEELRRTAKLKATAAEEIVTAGSTPEQIRKIATYLIRTSETKNRLSSAINAIMLAHDSVIDNARGNPELSDKLAKIYSIPEDVQERITLRNKPADREDVYNEYTKTISKALYDGKLSPQEHDRMVTQFASHIINSTQPMFKASNNPGFITSAGWLSNPLKTGFLFKKFADFYAGWAINSMRSDESLTSGQNAMHRTLAIAPLLAIAGMSGLPMAAAVKGSLKALGITDTDRDLREIVGDAKVSSVMLHGLPALLPDDFAPDFSRRAGLGDIAGAGDGNIGDALMNMFGGAPAQMLKNVSVDAYRDFASGNYTQAYMDISPLFIANLIKAVRAGTQGLQSGAGKQLISPEDISVGNIATQVIGMTPMKFTEAREFNETMKFAEESQKSTVKGFNERMAQAIVSGDQSRIQSVLDDIVRYDTRNTDPETRYSFNSELSAIKRRVQEMTDEQAGLKYTPKNFRPLHQHLKPLYTGE
jgi:hypothetical protein